MPYSEHHYLREVVVTWLLNIVKVNSPKPDGYLSDTVFLPVKLPVDGSAFPPC